MVALLEVLGSVVFAIQAWMFALRYSWAATKNVTAFWLASIFQVLLLPLTAVKISLNILSRIWSSSRRKIAEPTPAQLVSYESIEVYMLELPQEAAETSSKYQQLQGDDEEVGDLKEDLLSITEDEIVPIIEGKETSTPEESEPLLLSVPSSGSLTKQQSQPPLIDLDAPNTPPQPSQLLPNSSKNFKKTTTPVVEAGFTNPSPVLARLQEVDAVNENVPSPHGNPFNSSTDPKHVREGDGGDTGPLGAMTRAETSHLTKPEPASGRGGIASVEKTIDEDRHPANRMFSPPYVTEQAATALGKHWPPLPPLRQASKANSLFTAELEAAAEDVVFMNANDNHHLGDTS